MGPRWPWLVVLPLATAVGVAAVAWTTHGVGPASAAEPDTTGRATASRNPSATASIVGGTAMMCSDSARSRSGVFPA